MSSSRSSSREPDSTQFIAQIKLEVMRDLGQQNYSQLREFLKLQQIVLEREERIKELENKIVGVDVRVMQMATMRESVREQGSTIDQLKAVMRQIDESLKFVRMSAAKDTNDFVGKLEMKVKLTVDDIVQKFSHMEETFLELFRHKEKIFERIHLGYQNLLSNQETIEANVKKIISVIDRKADQSAVRACLSEFKQDYQSKIEDLSASGINLGWKIAQFSSTNACDSNSQYVDNNNDTNLLKMSQKITQQMSIMKNQRDLLLELTNRISQLEEINLKPIERDNVRYLSSPSNEEDNLRSKKPHNNSSSAGVLLQNFITDSKSSQGKTDIIFQTEKANQVRMIQNTTNINNNNVNRNLIFEAYEQSFTPAKSQIFLKNEHIPEYTRNTENTEISSPHHLKQKTTPNSTDQRIPYSETMSIDEVEPGLNQSRRHQKSREDISKLKMKSSVAQDRMTATKNPNRVRQLLDSSNTGSPQIKQKTENDYAHEQQLNLLNSKRTKGKEYHNVNIIDQIDEQPERNTLDEDALNVNFSNILPSSITAPVATKSRLETQNIRKTSRPSRSTSSHIYTTPNDQNVSTSPLTNSMRTSHQNDSQLGGIQKNKEHSQSQKIQIDNPLDRKNVLSKGSLTQKQSFSGRVNQYQPKDNLPPLSGRSEKQLSRTKSQNQENVANLSKSQNQKKSRVEQPTTTGYERVNQAEKDEDYDNDDDDEDVVYQIDADGYLMDEQGEYLRDEVGNFIIITSDQLENLRDQNLVIEEESY